VVPTGPANGVRSFPIIERRNRIPLILPPHTSRGVPLLTAAQLAAGSPWAVPMRLWP
jgi:hypothetical protein